MLFKTKKILYHQHYERSESEEDQYDSRRNYDEINVYRSRDWTIVHELADRILPAIAPFFSDKQKKLVCRMNHKTWLSPMGDQGGMYAEMIDKKRGITYQEVAVNGKSTDSRNIAEYFLHELGHALEVQLKKIADIQQCVISDDDEALADLVGCGLLYPEILEQHRNGPIQLVRDTIAAVEQLCSRVQFSSESHWSHR